jgi:hypothetical protein
MAILVRSTTRAIIVVSHGTIVSIGCDVRVKWACLSTLFRLGIGLFSASAQRNGAGEDRLLRSGRGQKAVDTDFI